MTLSLRLSPLMYLPAFSSSCLEVVIVITGSYLPSFRVASCAAPDPLSFDMQPASMLVINRAEAAITPVLVIFIDLAPFWLTWC
ncbi:hypothetical protein D3C71_1963700 [compost metagenome]